MLFHYFFHLILIISLHCQLLLRISGITKIDIIKITSQCKILIVPEEGWLRLVWPAEMYYVYKNHSTLCRFLPLFSSFWFQSLLQDTVFHQMPLGGCYRNEFCPGARFSKVPKLFGRISGDIILFVSSKQRRLEARNFAVILIFNPFTTYEKTSFSK